MKPNQMPTHLEAAFDQAAAAVRDFFDEQGVDVHDPKIRLAILCTWDMIGRSEPDYRVGLIAVSRALGI